jgi:hypothetical protein
MKLVGQRYVEKGSLLDRSLLPFMHIHALYALHCSDIHLWDNFSAMLAHFRSVHCGPITFLLSKHLTSQITQVSLLGCSEGAALAPQVE